MLIKKDTGLALFIGFTKDALKIAKLKKSQNCIALSCFGLKLRGGWGLTPPPLWQM